MSSLEANQASNAAILATSASWEDEGVLNDILLELDRERTRRAELEAQVRALTEEQQQSTSASGKPSATEVAKATVKPPAKATGGTGGSIDITLSRREYISLQTELEGYLQIIEALTRHNEAITLAASEASSASKQKSKIPTNPTTLPVHVVRLLEILPWDPRAQEHAFGVEEVYEWQIWKQNVWHAHIRHFPNEFQVLPVKKPNEEPQQQRRFLLDGSAPPQHTVLTNKSLTLLYKISNDNNGSDGGGYPLPHDGGTWQWIGGWQIDRHVTVTDPATLKEITLDCDAQGWTFAKEARHFLSHPSQCCYDNMDRLLATHKLPTATFFRRRKWVRRRALVRYPHASEATMQFLNLLAENAKLNMSLTKLSDQLVETKTKLTEAEATLLSTREGLARHAQMLEAELKQKDELIKVMQSSFLAVTRDDEVTTLPDSLNKKQKEQLQQVRTQLQKVLPPPSVAATSKTTTTTTVSTSAENAGETASTASLPGASSDVTVTALSATTPSKAAFDWSKLGRGAILDKMKPKTAE